jgi:aspartyl protease family protein
VQAGGGDPDWGRAFRLFWALALISLILVSLSRFRLGALIRGLAGWAAILLAVIAAYAFRDDAARLVSRVRTALAPDIPVADSPRSLAIGRGENGAFYVIGRVNGARVRFIVDTGSTEILLSPDAAARAGLHPPPGAFTHRAQTASGVGYGADAVAASLDVGPIRLADVPVTINSEPIGVSLLGAPFLRRLAGVEVRGDRMLLRGPG